MSRERLAVIGGGIAGLGAAWLLRKRYDVTVFERERHIGGHSNTVEVDEDGRRDEKSQERSSGSVHQHLYRMTRFTPSESKG